jgi:hypothetical protein
VVEQDQGHQGGRTFEHAQVDVELGEDVPPSEAAEGVQSQLGKVLIAQQMVQPPNEF